MLKNSFFHIKGVSQNKEKEFWNFGIYSWEDYLHLYENNSSKLNFLPKKLKKNIYFELKQSFKELNNKNLEYFKKKLNNKQHYRLYNYGKVAFVDIETTGLSKYIDDITLIGIFDGKTSHIYIKDKNLTDAFKHLDKFDILVTFNGKCFDIPFIEFKSGFKYDKIHLDLRYLLKEFNLSGGLKNIEKELGINRSLEIENIDGFEAVKLWKKYERGDLEALEKLKKYNEEDIVNLKFLIEWYIKRKKEELFNYNS